MRGRAPRRSSERPRRRDRPQSALGSPTSRGLLRRLGDRTYSRTSAGEPADLVRGLGLAADRARKRLHDSLEDVLAGEAVLGREVDRAVHLENDPATVTSREEVDTDEVCPDRGRGPERDQAGLRWRVGWDPPAAESDVRPPLTPR